MSMMKIEDDVIIPSPMKNSRGGNSNDNDDDDVIPTPTSLSDHIFCEILSRLPAKSLMRFKCVCKHWQSLIEKDPYFINLHFTRSKTRPPSLLLTSLMKHPRKVFMLADLFEDSADVHTIIDSFTHDDVVGGPVNGLICFSGDDPFAVRIYNLSTRELTPWIKTTVKKEEENEEEEYGAKFYHDDPTYQFGFDPATNEHKVICICDISRIKCLPKRKLTSTVTVCKVLTVGRNSWRRIELPTYLLIGTSIYVNGTIYWRKVEDWDPTLKRPEVIVAFDVGSEKFRVIPIPRFILDQPPISDTSFSGSTVNLLEIDGHVALLHRTSSHTVKLWIFDNHHKNTTNTSNNWIEEMITLPSCWKGSWQFYFKATEGTDQIIVHSKRREKFVSLHSYDRKEKTFKKVEINGISSVQAFRSCFLITTFVEHLLPVQNQQPHRTPAPPVK